MASTYEQTKDSFRLMFDKGELGYSDAVAISGIEGRQLRNGLERGTLRVGTKLRVGRWSFTLRDCLALFIIAQLTSRTWIPVSQAADVAAKIAPHAEKLVADVYEMRTNLDDEHGPFRVAELVIYQAPHSVEVVIHRRGGDDWGFYNFEGHRLEMNSWQLPHVRMPLVGAIARFMGNYSLALGDELPPGFEESVRLEAVADRASEEGGEA